MNKKVISLILAVVMLAGVLAGCTTVAPAAPAAAPAGEAAAPAGEPVNLQFTQWWEPELPKGEFRALMDQCEAQNPGVKVELISGPYATTTRAGGSRCCSRNHVGYCGSGRSLGQ